MSDRLFIGLMPAGVSYCDRQVEEDGDFKKLAFLPYDTLELDILPGCPDDLAAQIRKDASRHRAGDVLEVSTSGQAVRLGSKVETARDARPRCSFCPNGATLLVTFRKEPWSTELLEPAISCWACANAYPACQQGAVPLVGPRVYRYGASLRPPVFGGTPRPADALWLHPVPGLEDVTRHGVVYYVEPLDPDDADRFDLVPLVEPAEMAATIVADCTTDGYPAETLELEPRFFRSAVGQRFDRLKSACPGGLDAVLPLVTAGLRAFVEGSAS